MEGVVKIKNGDKELLASGMVLTFDSEPVEITLSYKDEIITFSMEFISDPEIKDLPLSFELVNQTSLKVKFTNHNNTLGTYNIQPFELGSIGNRLLYFNYFITQLNQTSRKKIDYSFYVGKEVQNG